MNKLTDDFKENVVKYIKYDDLIHEKKMEIADLVERKKELEKCILDFLIKTNENIINIGDDKIKKIDIKPKTKKPIKIELIKKSMDDVLDEYNIKKKDDIVNDVIDIILKTQNEIHYNLRRIKSKKGDKTI